MMELYLALKYFFSYFSTSLQGDHADINDLLKSDSAKNLYPLHKFTHAMLRKTSTECIFPFQPSITQYFEGLKYDNMTQTSESNVA